jgi:serine protease Do
MLPPHATRNLARLIIASALVACRADRPPALQVSSAGAQTSPQVQQAQTAVSSSRNTALVTAADRVSPAVVSINVTSRRQAPRRTPWDFFFVPQGAQVVQGYGTGFIIRPTGIILTNQHVGANA